MTCNLTLTLNVVFDLNGASPSAMKRQLAALVDHATNNGLLTGNTEATVDSYDFSIDDSGRERALSFAAASARDMLQECLRTTDYKDQVDAIDTVLQELGAALRPFAA